MYGYGALRGSEDLKPDPAVTGAIQFELSSRASVAGVISHSAVTPQPEMQYADPIAGSFDGDTLIDYRVLANKDLEIGTVESVEGILSWNANRLQTQLRGGYSKLTNVGAWQVDYDSLKNGTFQAEAVDRDLLFATAQLRMQLSTRIHVDAAVGSRQVKNGGIDYTSGPTYTGSILGWYVLPVEKVKVDITFGLGGKFRSDGNPYLIGRGDDAVFITDSYLSFDLKNFHLFFNFTNVFDLSYTLNGLQQPGRSLWWGFNWAFDN